MADKRMEERRQPVLEMAAQTLGVSVDEVKQMPWDEVRDVATRAAERERVRAREDVADLDALIDGMRGENPPESR
jgi:hypothetical protein